jgi:hypothetical protein
VAHDIFISYSTANQAWAESALRLLESHGLSCWMAPRDIRPSSTWAAEIVHGISNARVMLLLLSSASNQSRQVAREVQLADSSQLRILPVLLEAVKPEGDFVYFLSNTQWLTALGGTAADHSTTLLAAVDEALNASPPKPEGSAAVPEFTVRSSPSLAGAQNAPSAPPEATFRAAPAIETYSSASPALAATPLAGRPMFWVVIGVAVVLIGVAFLFLRSSPKPDDDSHQPIADKQKIPPRPLPSQPKPQPPSPALAGTWKGDVATNAVTIQIQVQPGDRIVVLVDNQVAKTEREPAEVLEVSGGYLEMDMGRPPRARCKLRLASDRRNLEGTWTQNKTNRTFNVVFTKAD